uniref:Uncharacterized protein n=1 Tax=Rhizophora mucronata TaxID=61149 RepID=A0A2P2QVE9_RHIMU
MGFGVGILSSFLVKLNYVGLGKNFGIQTKPNLAKFLSVEFSR